MHANKAQECTWLLLDIIWQVEVLDDHSFKERDWSFLTNLPHEIIELALIFCRTGCVAGFFVTVLKAMPFQGMLVAQFTSLDVIWPLQQRGIIKNLSEILLLVLWKFPRFRNWVDVLHNKRFIFLLVLLFPLTRSKRFSFPIFSCTKSP